MKRCHRFPVPVPVRDGSLLSDEAKALWARLEDCGAVGEENAITCRELAKASSCSTRKIQAMRQELITKGHKPLGSSTGSKEKGTKGGYFILRTAEERRHCVAALKSRARVILAEAEILDNCGALTPMDADERGCEEGKGNGGALTPMEPQRHRDTEKDEDGEGRAINDHKKESASSRSPCLCASVVGVNHRSLCLGASVVNKTIRDDQWGLFEGLELPTAGQEKRTQEFLRHH